MQTTPHQKHTRNDVHGTREKRSRTVVVRRHKYKHQRVYCLKGRRACALGGEKDVRRVPPSAFGVKDVWSNVLVRRHHVSGTADTFSCD